MRTYKRFWGTPPGAVPGYRSGPSDASFDRERLLERIMLGRRWTVEDRYPLPMRQVTPTLDREQGASNGR
jgi:hypothetical protein